jgi:anti-sigma factor RsiW
MTAPPLTEAGQAVEELLPFHATGAISQADRKRVEDALASDPELRRRLGIIEEERDETILLNESLSGPSTHALDRLMASIAAEPERAAFRAGLAERFAGWLQGLAPRPLAYAALAAAAVVALQAGALIGLVANRPSEGFQTASHGAQATSPRVDLTIIFTADAKAADIVSLLSRNGLTLADGPRAGGVFGLRAGEAPPAPAALEAVIVRLRAEAGLVRLVAPAPQGR